MGPEGIRRILVFLVSDEVKKLVGDRTAHGCFLNSDITDSGLAGFFSGLFTPIPDTIRGAHEGCIPIIKKTIASMINPNWAISIYKPWFIVKKKVVTTSMIA
jgi:hypothetical protein